MNAQQLKNAILQEAIEGRLVPQDPNDEPASVLLARIRKEKEQLVKEGKLKKKDLEIKPISEDEIPFEIPESWEWVRLITLSKYIHYGYTASAALKGNSKLLRITDIQDDKVNWATVPFCTIKDNDLEKYQLHNRDILIARTGGTIGKTYIVRELNEVAVFASYLIRAIPLESVYEEYLKLFMGSPCYWTQLTDVASGTGQPNVNGQSLSNLIVPLPPLTEQHRIVAKIEELLPKIEEYGKAQDALNKLNAELPERLKKSILQEAITGRLVPQNPNDEPASVLLERIRKEKEQLVKDKKIILSKPEKAVKKSGEPPFGLPSNWTWALVNDVCRVFGRIGFRGYTKSDLRESKEGAAISLSPSNMINGILDFSSCTYISEEKYEESPEIQIKNGDILIVKTGSSYGKTSIVKNLPWKSTINPQIAVVKEVKIDAEFLKYYFQSSYAQSCFKSFVLGTSIPTFSQLNLISMIIPLPPLAEQKRIVAKIEQLFAEIDKLKK